MRTYGTYLKKKNIVRFNKNILFINKIMFSFPFRNHAFYYKEALQNWNGSLPTTKGWQ